MLDQDINDDVMRFWRQKFDTASIAKFLQMPECLIERILHREMDKQQPTQRVVQA